jgi:cob(I)alamin adenosyltransferase
MMKESKGRVLIFTGEGKGKTTAALGMTLRAAGHGQRILIVQFIKADNSTGEIKGLEFIPGIKLIRTGLGFVPSVDDPAYPDHVRAAQEAWRQAAEGLNSGTFDLVILDEIFVAIKKGLVKEDQLLAILKEDQGTPCIVLTGRGAGQTFFDLADTVTVMDGLKHGLQQGWTKQKGVEY